MIHQHVRDTGTWWRVWRNVRTGRVRARSDYTAADLPQEPRDKPAPHSCFSPWIHPSRVRLIKQTQASDAAQPTALWSSEQTLRFEVCFLWSGLYMCHCVKATNTFRICTNELLTASPQSIDRELSLPKDWMVLVEPMQSLKPSLTWHEATILCCLSNIQEEKKINAAWQHYIKSLCALIFLFCLCTFVWGVASRSRGPGGAELARTMWESEEAKLHMLSFFSSSSPPQFMLGLQKRRHLYRPFHPATSSITADRLGCTFNTNPQREPGILRRWRRSKQRINVQN